MTEELTNVKPLLVKMGELLDKHEHSGAEIINSCMTIVKTLYIDMGTAEDDTHDAIKLCLKTLNDLLPSSQDK